MHNHSIFNALARSPIKALENHMDQVCACADLLSPFFDALFQQDWTKAEVIYAEINQLKQQANQIKSTLRKQLPNRLLLSIDREDIFEFVDLQDNIASKAKDIAATIHQRQLCMPAAIMPAMSQFLQQCLTVAHHARRAVHELNALLNTGFNTTERNLLTDILNQLSQSEHDIDKQQATVCHQLYSIEKTLDPVDTIFLYRVIEMISAMADASECLGRRLHVLLVK